MVHPKYIKHVAESLSAAGIIHEVMIQDVQRAIDTENPGISEDVEELANRKGIICIKTT